MKEIDRRTIAEIGIPSMVLMERAALAVAEEVKKRTKKTEKIWCACGCGNNGADGVAAARLLHLAGYPVMVVYIGNREKGSEEFKRQAAIAENLGISVIFFREFIPGSCDAGGCRLWRGTVPSGRERISGFFHHVKKSKTQAYRGCGSSLRDF